MTEGVPLAGSPGGEAPHDPVGVPPLSRGRPDADAAVLARRLLPCAHAAFLVVPESARPPLCAAVDAFLRSPTPSRFLAAYRLLEQARRRAIIERAGRGVFRRALADGLAALGGVSSLPPVVLEVLTGHLPVDARAGERLKALAALASAYQELSARVSADSDRRRRLWKNFPRRRPHH
ncbi:MAG: hypothetical protein ABJA82_17795 [Myxococcales bacterium]